MRLLNRCVLLVICHAVFFGEADGVTKIQSETPSASFSMEKQDVLTTDSSVKSTQLSSRVSDVMTTKTSTLRTVEGTLTPSTVTVSSSTIIQQSCLLRPCDSNQLSVSSSSLVANIPKLLATLLPSSMSSRTVTTETNSYLSSLEKEPSILHRNNTENTTPAPPSLYPSSASYETHPEHVDITDESQTPSVDSIGQNVSLTLYSSSASLPVVTTDQSQEYMYSKAYSQALNGIEIETKVSQNLDSSRSETIDLSGLMNSQIYSQPSEDTIPVTKVSLNVDSSFISPFVSTGTKSSDGHFLSPSTEIFRTKESNENLMSTETELPYSVDNLNQTGFIRVMSTSVIKDNSAGMSYSGNMGGTLEFSTRELSREYIDLDESALRSSLGTVLNDQERSSSVKQSFVSPTSALYTYISNYLNAETLYFSLPSLSAEQTITEKTTYSISERMPGTRTSLPVPETPMTPYINMEERTYRMLESISVPDSMDNTNTIIIDDLSTSLTSFSTLGFLPGLYGSLKSSTLYKIQDSITASIDDFSVPPPLSSTTTLGAFHGTLPLLSAASETLHISSMVSSSISTSMDGFSPTFVTSATHGDNSSRTLSLSSTIDVKFPDKDSTISDNTTIKPFSPSSDQGEQSTLISHLAANSVTIPNSTPRISSYDLQSTQSFSESPFTSPTSTQPSLENQGSGSSSNEDSNIQSLTFQSSQANSFIYFPNYSSNEDTPSLTEPYLYQSLHQTDSPIHTSNPSLNYEVSISMYNPFKPSELENISPSMSASFTSLSESFEATDSPHPGSLFKDLVTPSFSSLTSGDPTSGDITSSKITSGYLISSGVISGEVISMDTETLSSCREPFMDYTLHTSLVSLDTPSFTSSLLDTSFTYGDVSSMDMETLSSSREPFIDYSVETSSALIDIATPILTSSLSEVSLTSGDVISGDATFMDTGTLLVYTLETSSLFTDFKTFSDYQPTQSHELFTKKSNPIPTETSYEFSSSVHPFSPAKSSLLVPNKQPASSSLPTSSLYPAPLPEQITSLPEQSTSGATIEPTSVVNSSVLYTNSSVLPTQGSPAPTSKSDNAAMIAGIFSGVLLLMIVVVIVIIAVVCFRKKQEKKRRADNPPILYMDTNMLNNDVCMMPNYSFSSDDELDDDTSTTDNGIDFNNRDEPIPMSTFSRPSTPTPSVILDFDPTCEITV